MKKLILILFLAVCSREDRKKKSIPLWILTGGAWIALLLWGIPAYFGFETLSMGELAGGALEGILLLILSRIWQQSIGAGDGMIFLVSGLMLGGRKNLILMWTAFLLAGAAGLFWWFTGKKTKRDTYPLAPFILAAMLILGGLRII